MHVSACLRSLGRRSLPSASCVGLGMTGPRRHCIASARAAIAPVIPPTIAPSSRSHRTCHPAAIVPTLRQGASCKGSQITASVRKPPKETSSKAGPNPRCPFVIHQRARTRRLSSRSHLSSPATVIPEPSYHRATRDPVIPQPLHQL